MSRNVEGRDKLILAKGTELTRYRKRIRGIQEAIQKGLADDEVPVPLTIDKIGKRFPRDWRRYQQRKDPQYLWTMSEVHRA